MTPTSAPRALGALLLAALLPPLLSAQAIPTGDLSLEVGAAVLGRTLEVRVGSPSTPGGNLVLGLSDAPTPTLIPGVGTLALDYLSPAFSFLSLPLDASGEGSLSLPVPVVPGLIGAPPIFAAGLVVDTRLPVPGSVAVSRTVDVRFQLELSWRQAGGLSVARAYHSATSLSVGPGGPDDRVLIAGGGQGPALDPGAFASTELWDPLLNASVPGPMMSVARSFHRSVRLADGRVLITGGTDALGAALRAVDLFDPTSDTITPAAPMLELRVGHAATLLSDGRVLVTGGLGTFVDPANNGLAVFGSARSSAELYDPNTNTWSLVSGGMSSPRSGHEQVQLADGRVIVISGINGAIAFFGFELPTFTGSTEIFDPTSDSFTPAAALAPGRAFFAASRLGSGEVLVSGGGAATGLFGSLATIDSCLRFDGTRWQAAAPLPNPSAFHAQIASAGGEALIVGGASGSINGFSPHVDAGFHDGANYRSTTILGMDRSSPLTVGIPLASHAIVRRADGSLLLTGGNDADIAMPSTSSRVLRFIE